MAVMQFTMVMNDRAKILDRSGQTDTFIFEKHLIGAPSPGECKLSLELLK